MPTSFITVIGAGNMGRCLVAGLIKKDYPAEKIWVASPGIKKLAGFHKEFGVNTTTDNCVAANHADIIIFAVKPNIIQPISTELAEIIQQQRSVVVSVAAGVKTANITDWLGGNAAVIRGMPNVASFIGCGATALFANPFVTDLQRNEVASILNSVGTTLWIENEKLMNAVTALSGCGPAYFFLLIEALHQAGLQLGLPSEEARLLTLQTAYGACRMAAESSKTAVELIAEVASPGGSTLEALQVLNKYNFNEIIFAALQAACFRAEEKEKLVTHLNN